MTNEHLEHPDSHALDDWPIYGPQDGRIAMLVLRLANDHGMRLGEIEALIIDALEVISGWIDLWAESRLTAARRGSRRKLAKAAVRVLFSDERSTRPARAKAV